MTLFREAGYTVKDGKMVDARGTPLAFEIMTQNEGQEKMRSPISAHWPPSASGWRCAPWMMRSTSSAARPSTMT